MAAGGSWRDMDEQSTLVLYGFAAAGGSFILCWGSMACLSTTDAVTALWTLRWARYLAVIQFFAAAFLVQMELQLPSIRLIEFPHLGIVLPISIMAISIIIAFSATHPAVRWVGLVCQMYVATFGVLASAHTRVFADCRAAGTCEVHQAWSAVEWYQVYYVLLGLGASGLSGALLQGALMLTMGCCRAKMPPSWFRADPLSSPAACMCCVHTVSTLAFHVDTCCFDCTEGCRRRMGLGGYQRVKHSDADLDGIPDATHFADHSAAGAAAPKRSILKSPTQSRSGETAARGPRPSNTSARARLTTEDVEAGAA